MAGADPSPHTVAIVVPVYRGEKSLPTLVDEMASLTADGLRTPDGHLYRVTEVLLVHDRGPDRSDDVIRGLASQFSFVRPVWLSRNYGQHAATLAGMASTTTEWIVTLDEDGQHNPADIPGMLDVALAGQAALVYAKGKPPHFWLRNATSKAAKAIANHLLVSGGIGDYSSFRLILGEIGRSIAAYSGHGTYLDAAIAWIVPRSVTCPVTLRTEADRGSGYNLRGLMSHFWRLVLTAGTLPLRVVSVLGAVSAVLGVSLAVWVLARKLLSEIPIQGWTSVMVVLLLGFGGLLLALGIIAEYVGVAVRMAMGRPTYLIVSDPATGPLHRAGPVAESGREQGT